MVRSVSWMQQKDDGRKRDGDGVFGKCVVIFFFFTHPAIQWTRNECKRVDKMDVEVKATKELV